MIALTREPLDVEAVRRAVDDPEHGGQALFVGITRREGEGRAVEALEYDAYEDLALAELERIAAEAGARHGARVAIVHRIGRVAVGEASVVVAASAAHRAEAFAACREGIDRLKETVPIWKCTHHADGGREWDPGFAPPDR
ncbi:MAG TPA: molybdenum cofactor biosynthesis protein MoaE [Miltoncostaeaceae bacterium]|nr:molybdenum cofactor biosynthesis protein MoaE [Miltoncostaeaceae bacterium]